jgi:cysteine sulfinate desulfinase/cysteine desulfurase-like protein
MPYIIGMARTMELVVEERESRRARARSLCQRVIGGLLEHIPRARLTGHPLYRLPNRAFRLHGGWESLAPAHGCCQLRLFFWFCLQELPAGAE